MLLYFHTTLICLKLNAKKNLADFRLGRTFNGWFCETSNNSELDMGSNKMSQILEMSASTDLFSHKHLFWTLGRHSRRRAAPTASPLICLAGKRSKRTGKLPPFLILRQLLPCERTQTKKISVQLSGPTIPKLKNYTEERERCKKPQGNQVNPTLLAAV